MRHMLPTLILLTFAAASCAQADVAIEHTKLSDTVFMLTGQGGNLGLSTGKDGTFLIDDQFAPLTLLIKKKIEELTDEPVKFVFNTHWHGDHTGGNENFGKAGAVIVAHENVRKRMSVEQVMEVFGRTVPAAPEIALPVITFPQELTFHLNGEDIHVFHVDNAHTDGDSIVHFLGSNVVHMGDTFFNGLYPFIDVGSGGNVDGVIAAGEKVLEMIDENTQLIPGHGPLGDAKALESYLQMLRGTRAAVAALVADGKSRDEVVAAQPTKPWDEVWGNGFMQPDVFAGILYSCVAQENSENSEDGEDGEDGGK